jgi:dipeptidase
MPCIFAIARQDAVADGWAIVAKNGDHIMKYKDVCDYVWIEPRRRHEERTIKATGIPFHQAPLTYKWIRLKRYDRWYVNCGVNEYGVVAFGNGEYHCREKFAGKGLTGNETIRLLLERSKTASEGMEFMRNHFEGSKWYSYPPHEEIPLHRTICTHRTAGSVVEFSDPVRIWIALGPPCASIYVPYYLEMDGVPLPYTTWGVGV